MSNPYARGAGLALGALLASSTTLVCCVLPAALVSLGAGAAVVGLVTDFPQLIWLSEHKALVFGVATAMVLVSAFVYWRSRRLPCPADAALAVSCLRLRRFSGTVLAIAGVMLLVGAGFAFWPW